MVTVNYKPRVAVHPDRIGVKKTKGPNRLFVLHTSEGSEGIDSAEQLCYFLTLKGDKPSPSRPGQFYGASYQYVIDTDGIYPAVPEDMVSYSAPPANNDGIHICFPGRVNQGRAGWLDQVSFAGIQQAALLIVDRSGPTGIPLIRRTPAQVVAGDWGICDHWTITLAYHQTDHTDVGTTFPWDVLFTEIARLTETLVITPEEEEDMASPIAALYEPNAALLNQGKNKTFGLLASGDIRHLSGPDVEYARAAKMPSIPIVSPEHYDQLEHNSRKGLPPL